VVVPNLVGLDPADAQDALAALGLTVDISLIPGDLSPIKAVNRQHPAPGTVVAFGARVKIVIGPAGISFAKARVVWGPFPGQDLVGPDLSHFNSRVAHLVSN
jgi:beta-lactam-binding protein with PASTA domain